MNINIYTNNNGVGLEADARILKSVLQESHDVKIIDWNTKIRRFGTLGIHLEHIRREYLRDNLLNAFIPNPEWFDERFRRLLKNIDVVLCKTFHGLEIFKGLHQDCRYIGFTSLDRFKEVEKKGFVHLSGKSMHKNTDLIVRAWNSLKDPLTIQRIGKNYQGNFTFIGQRIDDISMFLSSFQFHVCPSRCEGFGHYINEALSTGGIVLTTDAPPMNELVNNHFGFLMAASNSGSHCLSRTYDVSDSGLIEAVNKCSLLTAEKVKQMSTTARLTFLERDAQFKANLNNFIRCIQL